VEIRLKFAVSEARIAPFEFQSPGYVARQNGALIRRCLQGVGVHFREITYFFSDTGEPMLYSFAVRGLLTTHSLAAVLEQFTFCPEAEKLIKSGVLSSPAIPPQGRR